jgi:two-component system LytT family response regulator
MLTKSLSNASSETTNRAPLPIYHPVFIMLKEKITELYKRIEYLESKTSYHPKRISLPLKSRVEILPITEVVRCESDDNYCHIFLENDDKLLISKILKSIQHKINHPYFHRIHKSHLINQNRISSIDIGSDREILTSDGKLLPLSRNINMLTILKFNDEGNQN